jgi:hypothetical protein
VFPYFAIVSEPLLIVAAAAIESYSHCQCYCEWLSIFAVDFSRGDGAGKDGTRAASEAEGRGKPALVTPGLSVRGNVPIAFHRMATWTLGGLRGD